MVEWPRDGIGGAMGWRQLVKCKFATDDEHHADDCRREVTFYANSEFVEIKIDSMRMDWYRCDTQTNTQLTRKMTHVFHFFSLKSIRISFLAFRAHDTGAVCW